MNRKGSERPSERANRSIVETNMLEKNLCEKSGLIVMWHFSLFISAHVAPRPEPKRRERGERDRDKAFGSIREEKTETREIPKMEKTHPNLGGREGLKGRIVR